MGENTGKNISKAGKDINKTGTKIGSNFGHKKQHHHQKLNQSSSNNTTSSSDNQIAATINMPEDKKIMLPAILIISTILGSLLGFVVIFNEKEATGVGATFGQMCAKITVTNTDCDTSNENCTNQYSGEVDLNDYIAGVVAAESQGITNLEYLKLLSIAVRSNLIANVGASCTVEGNDSFQKYVDVESSTNSSQVKQAVEETNNYIAISDNNIVEIYYGYGNIANADSTNYYISYGTYTSGAERLQTISKSWADNQSVFKNYLNNWQSTSTNNVDLSLIGALYLIENHGYSYQSVLEYYYGSDIEITQNTIVLTGINGFLNPIRELNCTSPFGTRIHPTEQVEEHHGGIDLAISGGEPIFAAKDGIINTVVNNITQINNCEDASISYGNYVIIEHDDGTQTLYSHMKYDSIPSDIYVGAEVLQGQQVGEVGSTGCSTGNHLHYEVRLNGERVDPADYLDLTSATGTCRN